MQTMHEKFKQENGYSELEISQKRTALEKVLLPDTIEAHFSRFRAAGFSEYYCWYRSFNFCSLVAIR